MVVRCAVSTSVLRAVLVFLWGAVGRIIVLGSRAAVQRASLGVDASVATLNESHETANNINRKSDAMHSAEEITY